MENHHFLKAMTEVPSVATACNPILQILDEHFDTGFRKTFVSDAFCLYQKANTDISALEAVFIAHLDEVGGSVLGHHAKEKNEFVTSVWGNIPTIFEEANLQAFDYLAESGAEAYPVSGRIEIVENEPRLILRGEKIRPYRTVFTFLEQTTFDGDMIQGKALDPRVTTCAVAEAVKQLGNGKIGALFVMAEERCMDVAKKAVTYLQRFSPNLRLVVNADVPGRENLSDGKLEWPAIRIFEGRNLIDPMFGIRMAEKLEAQNVEFHLTASRSGSQTLLFTPLAPTLSIALPSDGVHLPRVTMSLLGYERCIELLKAIGKLES